MSTKLLIDNSILNTKVNYQLAAETLNNDGVNYAEYGLETDEYKIDAVFYDGHNNTKVFAYVGYPKNATAENKVPAMVLVHGGVGRAERYWVERWNKLGFAAIAMDLYGRGPEKDETTDSGQKRHPYAGVPPFSKAFLADAKNAGMYQNVVAVVNAHNILRDSGVVDTENVGITGISWGGITTTTTIGVDNRFKFAAPVYGCGFLNKCKTYFKSIYDSEGATADWDAANFAAKAQMPVLYVNGNTDVHFSVDATTWTCDVTKNARMSILHRFVHGQEYGDSVEIVYAYAKAMVKDTDPFITVKDENVVNGKFTAVLDIPEGTTVQSATMYYFTSKEFEIYDKTDAIDWLMVSDYTLDGSSFEMAVPGDATHLYVSFVDQDGYRISSRFMKINE